MAAGRSHSHSRLRAEKFPAASTWEPKVLRIDGQWPTRSKRPGTKFWLWPESSLKSADDDRLKIGRSSSIESLLCGCSGRLANFWGARCSSRRLTLQGRLASGRRQAHPKSWSGLAENLRPCGRLKQWRPVTLCASTTYGSSTQVLRQLLGSELRTPPAKSGFAAGDAQCAAPNEFICRTHSAR